LASQSAVAKIFENFSLNSLSGAYARLLLWRFGAQERSAGLERERRHPEGDMTMFDGTEGPQGTAEGALEAERLIVEAINAADRIEAHCLFNLAAARGARDALRLRQELAAEMTPTEIAIAQRRARDLIHHYS
jgi:hypothetical protein